MAAEARTVVYVKHPAVETVERDVREDGFQCRIIAGNTPNPGSTPMRPAVRGLKRHEELAVH